MRIRQAKQKPQIIVCKSFEVFLLVPGAGVEPARHCCHWCLRPTRLPIPPSGHTVCRKYGNRECKCNENSAICNSSLPNFPVPGEFFEIARSVFRVRSGDPRTKRNAETDNRGQCFSPPRWKQADDPFCRPDRPNRPRRTAADSRMSDRTKLSPAHERTGRHPHGTENRGILPARNRTHRPAAPRIAPIRTGTDRRPGFCDKDRPHVLSPAARVSVAPRNHRKWGCLTSFINPSKIARSGKLPYDSTNKKGLSKICRTAPNLKQKSVGYPIFPYFIRSSPYRRLPDRFFEGASSRRSRACGPADGYRPGLVRSGNLPHALGFDSGTARPK